MIATIFVALLTPMQSGDGPSATVTVAYDAGKCIWHIDGVVVDDAGLLKAGQGWAAGHRTARVAADDKAPYRCVGQAIYTLLQAGVQGVGFPGNEEEPR